MTFQITFSNVLLTLLYIAPAFILTKYKKTAAAHLPTLSVILIYICSPCMIVNAFITMQYSRETLVNMLWFFAATFIIEAVFMAMLYLIFHKRYAISKYRMCTIASVLGNVGFFGLPVISAVFPENPEVVCYSCMYALSMNTLAFTMGIYCLTTDKKAMTVKAAIINPSTLSLLAAIPLHLIGSSALPDILSNGIGLLAKMTTPVCMFILGIRLASVDFKKLFMRPFIYLIVLGKLVAFPLFCWLITLVIPMPVTFRGSLIILSAAPCASIILSLAEMYKSETELAANCVLLSTLLSIVTLPLISMLL